MTEKDVDFEYVAPRYWVKEIPKRVTWSVVSNPGTFSVSVEYKTDGVTQNDDKDGNK